MSTNPKSLSNLIPFKPGQSGNPGGRAVGARNRLQGDFLNALSEHFATNGKDAIERACKENPLGYIKAVASLMPKQFEAADPLEGMDNAELEVFVKAATLIRMARTPKSEAG